MYDAYKRLTSASRTHIGSYEGMKNRFHGTGNQNRKGLAFMF